MAKFDFKKFIQIVGAIGPSVLLLVPGGAAVAPFVSTIIHGIQEAEQIAGATGPEKKAHVQAIVADAVAVTNATGKAQLDPAAVEAAANSGIDAVIATVNIVRDAKPTPPAA